MENLIRLNDILMKLTRFIEEKRDINNTGRDLNTTLEKIFSHESVKRVKGIDHFDVLKTLLVGEIIIEEIFKKSEKRTEEESKPNLLLPLLDHFNTIIEIRKEEFSEYQQMKASLQKIIRNQYKREKEYLYIESLKHFYKNYGSLNQEKRKRKKEWLVELAVLYTIEKIFKDFHGIFQYIFYKEKRQRKGVVFTPLLITFFMIKGIWEIFFTLEKERNEILQKYRTYHFVYLDPAAGHRIFEYSFHFMKEMFNESITEQGQRQEKLIQSFIEEEYPGHQKNFINDEKTNPTITQSIREFKKICKNTLQIIKDLKILKTHINNAHRNTYDIQESFLSVEINPYILIVGTYLYVRIKENLQRIISEKGKPSRRILETIRLDNSILLTNVLKPETSLVIEQRILPKRIEKEKVFEALIVLGNPPYSVSSENKDPWITKLMRTYSVKEPNITRLYDDYVKFIRYSQYLIEKTGRGILCFITNRKFLDGKIYYGMRKSLLETFQKLYFIDLGGDLRKQRSSNEENIFDIQTGIVIFFLIKEKKEHRELTQSINYLKVTGEKEKVFDKLIEVQLTSKEHFMNYRPLPEKYMFLPFYNQNHYLLWNAYPEIRDCFRKTSRSWISSRDRFMIALRKEELKTNIELLEKRDFTRLKQRGVLREDDPLLMNEKILSTFDFNKMKDSIRTITYRPLDKRYCIFYTINKRCGASKILENFIRKRRSKKQQENDILRIKNWFFDRDIGINFVHSVQYLPFLHIFITRGLVDSGLFGYSTSKIAPLWINDEINLKEKMFIFIKVGDSVEKKKERANTGYKQLKENLAYVIGRLWDPYYNKEYGKYLLHSYPHIPLANNKEEFSWYREKGEELINLMLIESYLLEDEQRFIEDLKQDHDLIELKEKIEDLPDEMKRTKETLRKAFFDYKKIITSRDYMTIKDFFKEKKEILEQIKSEKQQNRDNKSFLIRLQISQISFNKEKNKLKVHFEKHCNSTTKPQENKEKYTLQFDLSYSQWSFHIGSIAILKHWLSKRKKKMVFIEEEEMFLFIFEIVLKASIIYNFQRIRNELDKKHNGKEKTGEDPL